MPLPARPPTMSYAGAMGSHGASGQAASSAPAVPRPVTVFQRPVLLNMPRPPRDRGEAAAAILAAAAHAADEESDRAVSDALWLLVDELEAVPHDVLPDLADPAAHLRAAAEAAAAEPTAVLTSDEREMTDGDVMGAQLTSMLVCAAPQPLPTDRLATTVMFSSFANSDEAVAKRQKELHKEMLILQGLYTGTND